MSSPNFWSAHLAHDRSSERRSRIILPSLFVRDMRGESTAARSHRSPFVGLRKATRIRSAFQQT